MCNARLPVSLLWLAAACAAPMAQAQDDPDGIGVGVELVLAVDVSRSMDAEEQSIQRRGYAEAFRSPEVQGTIFNGDWGQVAVTYVEWAGSHMQSVLIPWTLIDSRDAADAFAARIEQGPMASHSRTSIAGAIDFAAALFQDNGYSGLRRVIDISGDGPNNQGRTVTQARDDATARRITINGLPLMTGSRSGWGGLGSIPELDRYYEDCVIGGPGAFLIPVTHWDQFAAAVRYKLVLELSGLRPAPERLVRAQAYAPADCLIGEKMWNQRQFIME